MTKLILSTGNIVSGGPSIIRKPGAYRSNLELTNSLRSNFLAAQEFYASKAAEHGDGNGYINGNGTSCPRRRPSGSVWTAREKPSRLLGDDKEAEEQGEEVLYIPRIDWSAAGLQEEPSRYDITAKLFFLPTAPAAHRPLYAREALSLVLRELGGAPSVDLLIVSFPGMSFDGDCEWEADKTNAMQGDDDQEVLTWRLAIEDLHRRGLVKRLGIAEFGSEKLSRFLSSGISVRPAVDQINIKNCCNVPPPLVKLARGEGIELLVHSDCTDVLPKGTLRELLGQGLQGAGVLAADPAEGEEGEGGEGELRGELTPQWVVKYTAVVRDRGVIESKGYFAGAELKEI